MQLRRLPCHRHRRRSRPQAADATARWLPRMAGTAEQAFAAMADWRVPRPRWLPCDLRTDRQCSCKSAAFTATDASATTLHSLPPTQAQVRCIHCHQLVVPRRCCPPSTCCELRARRRNCAGSHALATCGRTANVAASPLHSLPPTQTQLRCIHCHRRKRNKAAATTATNWLCPADVRRRRHGARWEWSG